MKRVLATAIGLALLSCGGSALAVNDLETNASVPFSFANPGARSLGMGGAFIGLADDATTAYTNPAGLTQLRQTEVAVELRHTAFSTPYVNGGTVTTQPFSTAGLNIANDDSSANNVSYLSAVIPHDRWAFAFYRHELSRFKSSFRSDRSAVINGFTLFQTASSIDLQIVNWGAAAAYAATDKVSLGFGLSRYDFDFDTQTGRYNPGAPFQLVSAPQHGDDHGLGWNLGARFSFSESLSLGLSYRHAPRFDYSTSVTLLSNTGAEPLPQPRLLNSASGLRFDVPDVWGVGLSWRPSESLVVNFDVDRVMYSELTDGISTFFDPVATSQLKIEDGTEYHLGAEYTFTTMKHPFSLRGGLWHDPRHAIFFDGAPRANANPSAGITFDEAFATLFAGSRGSQTHYSVGGGWAFPSFQLDLAADMSKGVDTYSVSGVYRF